MATLYGRDTTTVDSQLGSATIPPSWDLDIFCCGAWVRKWHKGDIPAAVNDVRFSNRPVAFLLTCVWGLRLLSHHLPKAALPAISMLLRTAMRTPSVKACFLRTHWRNA
jgi:hypothetical protein